MTPWGTLEVPTGEARRWRVGPWALQVRRGVGEWTLEEGPCSEDPLDVTLGVSELPEEPIPEGRTLRIATADPAPPLLEPRGADRSMVVRPELPLAVVDSVVLYVSTPLWARVSLGGKEVLDVPTWRPSDTWFGSHPTLGVLAYAGRTTARQDAEGLVRSPARLVTRVELRNRANKPMPVDRIELPVPFLSLWALPDGRIWSSNVSIQRGPDGVVPSSPRFDPNQPPGPGAQRVAAPRQVVDANFLHRAFDAVLG